MDRRTFVLLSGAASGSLLVPLRGSFGWAPGDPQPGRLAFEFDDQHRWSLWYRGPGVAVPLIPASALGVRLADRLLTLGDLDDVSVRAGTPASGESTEIRGRGAGVFLEATFRTDPAAAAPRASLTLRIYPDVDLPVVSGVSWGAPPLDRTLPGPGDLLLHIDGTAPSIVPAPALIAPEIRSTGLLALNRRSGGAVRALGLIEQPDGPGALEAVARAGELSLDTLWTPPRPVSTAGDAESVTFCYQPSGDGVAALAGAGAPSEGDRALLAGRVPPAGLWLSGGAGRGDDLPELAAFVAGVLDPRLAPFVCYGAGQPGLRGHRWCTDQIHAGGLLAAGSLTPFAAPPEAPADWTLDGGTTLDPAHPDVRDLLRERSRVAVQDWGYDALILDELHAPCRGSHHGGVTHREALRMGLDAIRRGAGADTILWAGDLTPQTGTLDVVRVGGGVSRGWSGAAQAAVFAGLRSSYHRSQWLNDPGPVTLGDPLSLGEARSWLGLIALTGGAVLLTPEVTGLPDAQLDLVRRVLPPAAVAGRPLDASLITPPVAPAFLIGERAVPLPGPWRFRAGAAPVSAQRDFDDSDWEDISVPGRWADAGHPGYSGEAWYRVRFTAPAPPPGGTPLTLALGQIANADQAFLNGRFVGETGIVGLGTAADAQIARRYPVPADAVRWGDENVVAIRVSGGVDGGIWSGSTACPASLWVAKADPDWWTALVINWEERAVERTLRPADLGLPAGHYRAYDGWTDTPIALAETVRVALDPHESAVIGFRPRADHPQVIGTNRHVVQGAVDVRDEHWDAKTGTLSGRSVSLDGRPYAVTVAAAGWSPDSLRADRPGAVRVIDSEYLVLEWPGGERSDLGWELTLRRASRGRGRVARPH